MGSVELVARARDHLDEPARCLAELGNGMHVIVRDPDVGIVRGDGKGILEPVARARDRFHESAGPRAQLGDRLAVVVRYPHVGTRSSGDGPPDSESRIDAKTRRSTGPRIDRPTVYTVGMGMRAMQEPTFLILTALAKGSQHGYGIITDVEAISGGRVRLRAGTLYTALDRLCADELIEGDREEVVDGRLRRYYRLTPKGAKRLGAEAARLQGHATAALARLKLSGGMAK